MCLYCGDHKIQVAKENIICYKGLGPYCISPCFGMKYEVGGEYSLPTKLYIEKDWYENNIINIGFHAFLDKFEAGNGKCWINMNNYKLKEDLKISCLTTYITAKCAIPKGANFCYNDRENEIVSDKIIVLDIKYSNKAKELEDALEIMDLLLDNKLTSEIANLFHINYNPSIDLDARFKLRSSVIYENIMQHNSSILNAFYMAGFINNLYNIDYNNKTLLESLKRILCV